MTQKRLAAFLVAGFWLFAIAFSPAASFLVPTPGLPVAPSAGGTGATSGASAAINLSHVYIPCLATTPNMTVTDASITQLASCQIPAGLMGVNSVLRITGQFSYTNDANAKTLQVHFGAYDNANCGSDTGVLSISVGTTATYLFQLFIANQGSNNSQIATTSGGVNGSWGTTTATPITMAYNTAGSPTYVQFCAADANAGDSVTLNFGVVELLPTAGN